ncbi:MAG: hypothetical protein LLG06_05870, partial [Desulfobacteraceae bacterium]|nr:hypothetical protein [Desulfobacteraceae bacterium]
EEREQALGKDSLIFTFKHRDVQLLRSTNSHQTLNGPSLRLIHLLANMPIAGLLFSAEKKALGPGQPQLLQRELHSQGWWLIRKLVSTSRNNPLVFTPFL